jgi:hypothetical protein
VLYHISHSNSPDPLFLDGEIELKDSVRTYLRLVIELDPSYISKSESRAFVSQYCLAEKNN